jgi:hypothetical protein
MIMNINELPGQPIFASAGPGLTIQSRATWGTINAQELTNKTILIIIIITSVRVLLNLVQLMHDHTITIYS